MDVGRAGVRESIEGHGVFADCKGLLESFLVEKLGVDDLQEIRTAG